MVWHFHIAEPSKPIISCTAETGWIELFFCAHPFFIFIFFCKFLGRAVEQSSSLWWKSTKGRGIKDWALRTRVTQFSLDPRVCWCVSSPCSLCSRDCFCQISCQGSIIRGSFMSFIWGLSQARGKWGLKLLKLRRREKRSKRKRLKTLIPGKTSYTKVFPRIIVFA